MTTANQRSALAALNHVRPIIARLAIARHAEDLAADIIEGWNGTEVSLRSLLGGSALSGQARPVGLYSTVVLALKRLFN